MAEGQKDMHQHPIKKNEGKSKTNLHTNYAATI